MPRKDTPGYVRLTPEVVEANLGDFDYAILGKLPEAGSKLGYHPLFKSAKHLLGELNAELPKEAQLRVGLVSARLRILAMGKLTTPVSANLSGKVDGWQRTARGKDLYEQHKRGEQS